MNAQEFLRHFFNGMRDGVLVSDGNARVLYMNPAAERMLGPASAHALTKTVCELLCAHLSFPGCADCRSRCGLASGLSGTAVQLGARDQTRFEWRQWDVKRLPRFRDLRVRCLKLQTDLFGVEDLGTYFTLVEDGYADVEAVRLREEWRDMVAHDLRSPLADIYAVLRIIQDREPGHAAEPAESLLVANGVRACRRLVEVVNLYMDILQLETGMMPVSCTKLFLGELVEERVKTQAALSRQRGVEVAVAIDAQLTVNADRALLGAVVDNLLNNALKFTPGGGRVTLEGRPRDGLVELSIRDSGPGLDERTAALLFDRLYQAKMRHQGRLKGNGLGLAYCKEAMGAMGGHIALKTSPGNGCEFVLGFGGEPA